MAPVLGGIDRFRREWPRASRETEIGLAFVLAPAVGVRREVLRKRQERLDARYGTS